MKEMICITCPIGCHLKVEVLSETEVAVSGNKCARGELYAKAEVLSPKRVVTATCGIEGGGGRDSSGHAFAPRRIPVRTVKAFPREKIPELLDKIYSAKIKLPVKSGQIILRNALDTGIDVVATRSM